MQSSSVKGVVQAPLFLDFVNRNPTVASRPVIKMIHNYLKKRAHSLVTLAGISQGKPR